MAVGAFCIPKNQNRLMLNPTVINSRNLRYLVFTKSLAREYIACGICLEPHEICRRSADDLWEMYYTFKVPHGRARINAMRMLFEPKGFKVYDWLFTSGSLLCRTLSIGHG